MISWENIFENVISCNIKFVIIFLDENFTDICILLLKVTLLWIYCKYVNYKMNNNCFRIYAKYFVNVLRIKTSKLTSDF